MRRNKQKFIFRVLFNWKHHNTTITISGEALGAMLDMSDRMLRSGELKAISVEASR